MSAQLLEIYPKELQFYFEVKKQSACAIRLTNNTYSYVAFKVKTTSPKKYCVRPNVGVVNPKSSCEFTVTMQAQKTAPTDMTCKDKFLIQSTVVPVGTTGKEVTASMFSKDDGSRYVEEVKLRVSLISPTESPDLSPINGVLKPGPFSESAELKASPAVKVENLTPQSTQINKDVKYKITNSQEFTTMKDAESNPIKDEFYAQEANSAYDAELTMKTNREELKPWNFEEFKPVKMQEFKPSRIEELKPGKMKELKSEKYDASDEQLKPVKAEEFSSEKYDASDEQLKPVKAKDFSSVKNVRFMPENAVPAAAEVKLPSEELKSEEYTVNDREENVVKGVEIPPKDKGFVPVKAVPAAEELKLANDIEEMKLKLNSLESKLNEAEYTISKLTEERKLSIQERKILQEEVAALRTRTSVRKVQGFPLLFVIMIALIGIVLGYLSGRDI